MWTIPGTNTAAAQAKVSIRGKGKRKQNTPGPKPPYQNLDTNGKYSWVKAPRYEDQPMEVGPLARMLVAYASGHKQVKDAVDGVLKKLGVGPEALFSTLGRTAARGVDCLLIARETPKWLDQLIDNIGKGDYATHNDERWDPATWPAAGGRLRLARGSPGGAGALGQDQGPEDPQLPGGGARPPGTPPRAMRKGREARTRQPWSARRWRTRTSRSKSCAPSIPSIRASPVPSMC